MKTILLRIFIVSLIIASCKPMPAKSQDNSGTNKNKTVIADIKPDESGYADINGLKMYYEVYLPAKQAGGKGKPIVLLHGSYMNIPLNWSHIIPLMAKDRKVIVAEMQAHGRTKDIPRELSYEVMADDVSGLLKFLKTDSADILGYSMGGGIAFQLAVRHPKQVRRLVILSGTYAHDGWWPDVEAMFSTFTADMFKGTPIQKQYDSLGNNPAQFAEYVKKVISIDLKPYDWTKEVKNIKAPMFLLMGDADGVQYEHYIELFKAKGGGKMGDMHGLPKSRLAILPGTTHIGMLQHVDWWLPMVNDFLESDLNVSPPTF